MIKMRAAKAQIQSQVLVYILAVVIMAMVLVFGYRAVDGMKKQAEVAQLLTFRSDITNNIR
jgi:purine-cytosine permease-like protein